MLNVVSGRLTLLVRLVDETSSLLSTDSSLNLEFFDFVMSVMPAVSLDILFWRRDLESEVLEWPPVDFIDEPINFIFVFFCLQDECIKVMFSGPP